MIQTPHQSPFNRILFCTDFSPNADFAFDVALDSAGRRPESILYLFHVIPEPDAQFWKTYLNDIEGVDEKARQDINTKIEEVYLPRIPSGMQYEVVVTVGKDYQAILDFAREKNIDLIIMGRQGHSQLEKVLFGNVTERVARKADCAVLIIPLSFKAKQSAPPPY